MTKGEIRKAVVGALASIAPETDAAQIDPSANLRETLELDSMDFLNFVALLHEQLHVAVPEADYPKVSTLDACVAYLASHLGVP